VGRVWTASEATGVSAGSACFRSSKSRPVIDTKPVEPLDHLRIVTGQEEGARRATRREESLVLLPSAHAHGPGGCPRYARSLKGCVSCPCSPGSRLRRARLAEGKSRYSKVRGSSSARRCGTTSRPRPRRSVRLVNEQRSNIIPQRCRSKNRR
jgi:hypothetical protein